MRLYSEEWIAAFNVAVADLPGDGDVSLRMLQVVEGGPEGTVRVGLFVEDDRVTMVREPAGDDFDVTIRLQFEDAEALSRGQLDPAKLLESGRVRVRGDLSTLVAGQAVLAAAVPRLEPLSRRASD